jgi:hypothetical protein
VGGTPEPLKENLCDQLAVRMPGSRSIPGTYCSMQINGSWKQADVFMFMTGDINKLPNKGKILVASKKLKGIDIIQL